MPLFDEAPHAVTEVIEEMIDKFHGQLRDHGVIIDALRAFAKTDRNGDPVGPALKHNGYQAAAVVRITPYKLRVQGHGDAEITVDGDRWPEWSPQEQRAIIDHELQHLELMFDREGGLLRDDLGRPRLKMRLHDHQFGWFDAIARRHGPASVEVQQFKHMIENHRQLYFEFDGGYAKELLQVGASNGTNTQVKRKRAGKTV